MSNLVEVTLLSLGIAKFMLLVIFILNLCYCLFWFCMVWFCKRCWPVILIFIKYIYIYIYIDLMKN
jgi:hypothetical protein